MKVDCFNEGDSVLLLGEGNFTFSASLFEKHLNIKITATCFEYTAENPTVKKNIEYLLRNEIEVLLGVDATKLMEHPVFKTRTFDKIIFNFPHVGGKMRIDKNRELLREFFIAAENLTDFNSFVLVTLCNGQGGIPLDKPPRRWNDSWKIVEMAAHGNFILHAVEPFLWSSFRNYIVTGYRSLDKTFCTTGALTYFFRKAEPPDLQNIGLSEEVKFPSRASDEKRKNFTAHIEETPSKLSLYPPSFTFDITFSIGEQFNGKTFFEVLYNCAAYIIEDVKFIGTYIAPCDNRVTQTYRITYKSYVLPLHKKRVIDIHQRIIADILEEKLKVAVSR